MAVVAYAYAYAVAYAVAYAFSFAFSWKVGCGVRQGCGLRGLRGG